MTTPAPPGLWSPSAFPFPPGGLPNDAPPVTPQPYFAGSGGNTSNVTTITVSVQNPVRRGDAIVVGAQFRTGSGNPVSCADTQGNAYSLVGTQSTLQPDGAIWVAQNAQPLTSADTITVTLAASSALGKQAIAVGVPCGSVITSPGSAWLTYGTGSSASGNAVSLKVTAPSAVAGPVMTLAFASAVAAAGTLQFPQNWNVLRTMPSSAGFFDWFMGAYLPAPSGIPSGGTVFQVQSQVNGQNVTAQYIPLLVETRLAPSRVPVTPPGMQSPGAWQYQPLSPPEGPWSTRYSGTPYKFTETLPAAPVSQSAVTRSTGKTAPAASHPAGALARSARKTAAAAAHATGTLARSAGKRAAAAVHPLAAAGILRARTLAAAVHPAGTLAKSAGKHAAATAHAAAAVAKGRTKTLAARVISAARLLLTAPAPSFNLGVPGTEWSVSISTIGISQLSTQYVLIPVAAAKAGVPYNPTTHPVQFAFMPTVTKVPGSSDWVAGSWEANPASLIYPYTAKCLVGPAGTVNPGIGTYIMYVKITENPDIPVLIAGQLQIS